MEDVTSHPLYEILMTQLKAVFPFAIPIEAAFKIIPLLMQAKAGKPLTDEQLIAFQRALHEAKMQEDRREA